MPDFESVLNDARQLSAEDQLRLIEVISAEVPEAVDEPLDPEWEAELDRRDARRASGESKLTPWSEIRAEALQKLKDKRT
jgi:putative addiction module component (TIGR02574 family)